MEEIFIGVMDHQEAKNHQIRLKAQGVVITLKNNDETCGTGNCKVRVEVWAQESDKEMLMKYLRSDFEKHVKGHVPNYDHLSAVYDPSAEVVTCQACGASFNPKSNECPDCGLVY